MSSIDDLRLSLGQLLTTDPVVVDANDGTERPLSSFRKDAAIGWCGYVEEVVTDHLEAAGFKARAGECGSPTVTYFGLHYVTMVDVEDCQEPVVVDFTAWQIPGLPISGQWPLILPVSEYLTRTGLEGLAST